MDRNLPKSALINKIQSILEYQFGKNAFSEIFEDTSKLKIDFSRSTGKIKTIHYAKERFFSYKAHSGYFSLSLNSAKWLHRTTKFPAFRIRIINEVKEYIQDGKSVFSKHVLGMDENLHFGDEVLVVDEGDELIAIGKLSIPSYNYLGTSSGQAVAVKKGIKT